MIGIIFISDLKYCPYLDRYVELMEINNNRYEVLFWNRDGRDTTMPDNYISYNLKSKLSKHQIFKARDFYLFRNWLKSQINLKKYDKLIILSTLSGIIISDLLLKEYSNRYIFDIRDYSYEYIRLFYNLEKKLIESSKHTFISSDGFRHFLPSNCNYITVNNFNRSDVINRKNFRKKAYGSTLNLTWIGSVRYFEHQRKIIDKLSNDKRYHLIYHGTGPQYEDFKTYCKRNDVKNIVFTGEYNNKDKHKLLQNADILNNSYKTSKIEETKYAISNKYYDGIIFGTPQLVETGSYKCDKVIKKGIGIGLDPDNDDFSDKLYEYYHSIDEKKFINACQIELNRILSMDESYINYIKDFINFSNR